MQVKAWVYEAGYHCKKCAKKKFKNLDKDNEDREGNPVLPVFSDEFKHLEEFHCCDTCLESF